VANLPGVEDAGDQQRDEKAADTEKTFPVREVGDKRKQREIDHDRGDHAGTIAAREHGRAHVEDRGEKDAGRENEREEDKDDGAIREVPDD